MAENLTLSYVGGIAAEGEMDTYAAAASILGFGNFVGVVCDKASLGTSDCRTTVRGLRSDSFDIDFAIHLNRTAAALFPLAIPIAEHIKLALDLFKLLRGEKPTRAVTSTATAGDSSPSTVTLGTVHGDVTVQQITYNIVADPTAGKAIEEAIRNPLERGVERVEVLQDGDSDRPRLLDSIERSNSGWYRRIPEVADSRGVAEQITDRKWLLVESVVFLEGKKSWRFHDGNTSFSARINDERFLRRVIGGHELFGSGDQLLVRLRTVQSLRHREIRAQYFIDEIYEHRRGADQLRLL